jgi:hypothetical protein
MSLFGHNPKKEAEKAAAAAEVARLEALPLPELAAELLPGYGKGGARRLAGATGINIGQLMIWLMRDYPRATGFMVTLQEPVRAAVQLLEHADLVERRTYGRSTQVNATALGEEAIAAGTAKLFLAGAASV